MTDTERLKNRLEEIQKEEKNKESKEKEYMEEMKTNEEKRLENEKQRKKLRETNIKMNTEKLYIYCQVKDNGEIVLGTRKEN